MVFRGLGFGVQGSRLFGLGFRVYDSRSWVEGNGFTIHNLKFKVKGCESKGTSSGLMVSGFRL